MRILYLNQPSTDHLWYMTYRGLCEVVGIANVIEYPYNSYHHEQSCFSYRLPCEGGNIFTFDEIKEMTFDIAILGELAYKINRIKELIENKPVIYLDGTDSQDICSSVELFNPHLIFKREYLVHHRYPKNCYPLPFSSVFENSNPLNERPIDVFFAVRDNHPRRWQTHCVLTQQKIVYVGRVSNQSLYNYNTYTSLLQNSKICVSVRGFGWDTLRFWEILASGALLVTDNMCQIIPNEFIHDEHCVYFDLNTLPWLINHYLFHSEKRQEIAVAGQNHLNQYHTAQNRAKYLIDIIRGKL